MTIAARLEQRGLKKGIEQGIQQGLQKGVKKGIIEGKKEAIVNLYKEARLPVEVIAKYLHLDIGFVRKTLKEKNILK